MSIKVESTMTLEQFKVEVDKLLNSMFGIELVDCCESFIEACFKSCETPQECVEQWGEKHDLSTF